MKPASRSGEYIENQVYAHFIRRVVRPVPCLVVERPQLSRVHHDLFIARRQRTPAGAPQDQVKAIPDSIVGTGIDMREHAAVRQQGHQGRTTEGSTQMVGNALAVRQRARKSPGCPCVSTLVDIVRVLCAGRQRFAGSAQIDVACVALAANFALPARVHEPHLGRRVQFRQQRPDVHASSNVREVCHAGFAAGLGRCPDPGW